MAIQRMHQVIQANKQEMQMIQHVLLGQQRPTYHHQYHPMLFHRISRLPMLLNRIKMGTIQTMRKTGHCKCVLLV